MEKCKGTKGGWIVDHNKSAVINIGKYIRMRPEAVLDNFETHDEYVNVTEVEVDANVKLIAQAPTMLMLLQSLENDNNSIPKDLWNKIQSSISKATK